MDLRTAVTLLPTPAVNDMGKAYTPEEWDAWTERMKAAHGNGNGHGKSLEIEAARLTGWIDETPAGYVPPYTVVGDDMEWEPCPECGCIWDDHDAGGFCMGDCGGNKCNGRQFLTERRLLPTPMVGSTNPAAHGQISGDFRAKFDEALTRFGEYGPAIQRWENTTGMPAPAPTEPTGKNGAHRLSPKFTSWMMGLPPGWITDVPGITRNEALKACGNGVVPQQAYAAIVHALDTFDLLDARAA